jgi:hypothetical protein
MRKYIYTTAAAISISVAFVFHSCVKDKGLKPAEIPPPPVSACDTITWNKQIKAIVSGHCSTTPGCHTGATPTGNTSLDTYAQVRSKAEAGRIKARVIDHVPTQMPPAANPEYSLSVAEKGLISCWLDNGYKE